jgi:hypothetical protein
MKKKKMMAKSLTLLVTVASLSAILLVGISIAATASLSPANNYNSGSSYKRMTCLDKVLEFGQEGLVRDAGGFNGALFECSHAQWAGSIYGVIAK